MQVHNGLPMHSRLNQIWFTWFGLAAESTSILPLLWHGAKQHQGKVPKGVSPLAFDPPVTWQWDATKHCEQNDKNVSNPTWHMPTCKWAQSVGQCFGSTAFCHIEATGTQDHPNARPFFLRVLQREALPALQATIWKHVRHHLFQFGKCQVHPSTTFLSSFGSTRLECPLLWGCLLLRNITTLVCPLLWGCLLLRNITTFACPLLWGCLVLRNITSLWSPRWSTFFCGWSFRLAF